MSTGSADAALTCAASPGAASTGALPDEVVPGEALPGEALPGGPAASAGVPDEPATGVDAVVAGPAVAVVPHIALAVRDASASAAWWCRTFGFESAEQPASAPTRPRVVIRHPDSGLVLGFRQSPEPGRRGRFEYLSLRVASERALGDWAAHLHRLGIPHSSVRDTGDEQFLSLTAPDGMGLELWWSRPRDAANRVAAEPVEVTATSSGDVDSQRV